MTTRRRRARRGLESLEVLEREGVTRIFLLDDEVVEHDQVDAKLVALARRLQLRLLTNDGPLARNAELQGVPTCNLRRLAQELAPAIVPGDFVRVALTRSGKEDGQGVGHLDDGSMVVVNGGEELVGGPEVMLQVTSVVPTNAGRLLFAASRRAEPGAPSSNTGGVRTWAIVVAAGGGVRFGGAKQFASLGDSSVLDLAVDVARSACDGVVVVLPPESTWQAPAGVQSAAGGATRSDSVRAGLAHVPDDVDIVVVHDAARPLASRRLFELVVAAVAGGADARGSGAAGQRHVEARRGRACGRDGAAREPGGRADTAGVPRRPRCVPRTGSVASTPTTPRSSRRPGAWS